ncbi:MAG: CPBP family intramembrane metalloprotease [Propionibacteriales bacterium]|nr:CPBP family intramembrane metalloprotease [Propionibacteriales bacterium]
MSEDLRYDQLQRLGPRGAWRPWVGLLLLVLLVMAAQLVMSVVVMVVLLATGTPSGDVSDKLTGDPVTPSFLALVNLGWAVAIPAVWLIARALHGQAPGWVASVVRGIRWRWLLACLGLSAVALVATVVVAAVLPDQGASGVELEGNLNPWTSTARDFLLITLLLTPLQAAGEEYVFRGYLAQAFGGITARFGPQVSAAVAVGLPALLFALAHGLGQDLPTFFDRFAFGVVAGVLVLLTGGLEAGIAMHVLNNFLAFGLALSFGDMTEALHPSGGTWWSIPVTLTQSLSYLALALWAARRTGLAARAKAPMGGAILDARRGRV